MNPNRLTKLLFLALGFLQLQAKAQSITSPVSGNVVYSGASATNVDLDIPANTSLTISGTSLTVTGVLKLNGTIYLRNGGQLIQGSSSTIDNTSTGNLSVYQEGTVNNYGINYWCSPVGDGSSSNLFGLTLLGYPKDGTWQQVNILADNQYDGLATTGSVSVAPHWINTLSPRFGTNNQGYYDWHNEGINTPTIPPGYGFMMKGTSGTDANHPTTEATANRPADPTAAYMPYQRYEFRGKPNNGNIEASLSYHTEPDPNDNAKTIKVGDFTLVGNPYPSAIDLDAFLWDNDNADTDQVAYFWEQGPTPSHNIASYTGGYGVYTPNQFTDAPGQPFYVPATFYSYNGDGSYGGSNGKAGNNNGYGNPDRQYAPIGQGFMVRMDPNYVIVGDTSPNKIVLKNSHRFYKAETTPEDGSGSSNGTGSVFSKKQGTPTQQTPQIRFNTTYDNGSIGQMLQVFGASSTTGLDRGKDVRNPNYGPSMVNFLVGDDRCVISAVPFDIDIKIPLIFDNVSQATYKMTVQEMINLDQVSNVYLHDKVADRYYDIKNNFYQFTLPKGMNWEQYEITFKNNALGIDDVTEKSFDIFQNNEAKKLIVNNALQKELVSCELYDIAGKLILNKKQLGTQPSYEFSTSELSDGVYIVRATSQDNKTKAQKIVVKR